MIDFYMALLEKKQITLEDIPLYWKNQMINRLEDMKILGELTDTQLLDSIAANLEQECTDKDIEEYLNAQNDTATLDDGEASESMITEFEGQPYA